MKLGHSRPPLEIDDLPTPEEVFGSKRIGFEEMILFVLGPSVIALGISVGSGEWILGPLNATKYGLKGIGILMMISIILQVFYNIELARFTVATGEAPIVAFGRTPPGWWLWVPLALFSFYIAFILGNWTVNAGASLFALFVGRAYQPSELEFVRILGILLMFTCLAALLVGRKIERTMEAIQGTILPYIIIGLVFVTAIIVPWDFWKQAIVDLFTPSAPPPNTDASLLGSLAGFAALASGLNFMFIVYYRDKGYGMGHKVGYLSGLIGGVRKPIRPSGITFPADEKNTALWKRWFRYLQIDQWGIYFPGAVLGIFLPILLVAYLASFPEVIKPDQSTILVFASQQLGEKYGSLLSGWTLLTGFLILYSTQMVVLDLLARNLTDALYCHSAVLRKWSQEDARKIYYPIAVLVVVLVSIFIHSATPAFLLVLSGNLANFASLIFPLMMIYLNLRLPRPARISWLGILMMIANVIFFGFFFINFLFLQITGSPLVSF